MKKSILRTILASCLLLGTAVGAVQASKEAKLQSASANSTLALINWNGNQKVRYRVESNNPDKWGSYSGDSNSYGGMVNLSDLTTAINMPTAVNGASDIGPFTISGRAGSTITITEREKSHDCVGMYIPLAIYFNSVDPYTENEAFINFNLSITGGSSSNYSTAVLYHGGIANVSGDQLATPVTTFKIPKNNAYAVTKGGYVCASASSESSSSTTTVTGASYLKGVATNRSSSTAHIIAYYCSLFISARKDSSSYHQLTVKLSASLDTLTATKFVAETNGVAYETLNEAVDACSAGGTVTLLKSLECTSVKVSKKLTIDLNGYDIKTTTTPFNVTDSGDVTFKGTGKLYGYLTKDAVLTNSGVVTVPSTMTIQNTATAYQNACGVLTSGSFTTTGTITSPGYAIKLNGGSANIAGGTLTTNTDKAIYAYSGSLYLYNSPSITAATNKEEIYLNLSSCRIYGRNSASTAYYRGTSLKVFLYSGTPAVDTVVIYGVSTASKFVVTNTPGVHCGYEYDSSTNNLVYVKHPTYRVTYNTNGGLGYLEDTAVYEAGEKATVKESNFTRKYYTLSGWATTSDAAVAQYHTGDQVTITGNTTLYAVWVKTSADYCEEFTVEYLKMNTYDTGLDNSKGNNSCKTYYSTAKTFYLNMPDDAKALFATSTFEDSQNRFAAWARANGETIDFATYNFTFNSSSLIGTQKQDNLVIIIVSVTSILSMICIAALLKKRKMAR